MVAINSAIGVDIYGNIWADSLQVKVLEAGRCSRWMPHRSQG
jgi:hypothetical protein